MKRPTLKLAPFFCSLATSIMAADPIARTSRAIDTDPANFVEGPYTLEEGGYQIEWGAYAYGQDRTEGFFVESQSVSALVLRAALSANTEIQLFHDGWMSERTEELSTDSTESISGLGDMALQLKHNFFGNDEGVFALGATLFTVFDMGHQDITVGENVIGGSLVFAATLYEGNAGIIQAHSQLKYYHGKTIEFFDFSQSFTWGVDIDDRNSVALEANAYNTDEDGSEWTYLSSLTYTHAFNDTLTLDAAVTAGLGREAEDVGCFFILTRWL